MPPAQPQGKAKRSFVALSGGLPSSLSCLSAGMASDSDTWMSWLCFDGVSFPARGTTSEFSKAGVLATKMPSRSHCLGGTWNEKAQVLKL